MGVSLCLVSAFTLILGLQLTTIYIVIVTGAPGNNNKLTQTKEYEPPNQGGPQSSQGAGTR
jgi:hypothetical protein